MSFRILYLCLYFFAAWCWGMTAREKSVSRLYDDDLIEYKRQKNITGQRALVGLAREYRNNIQIIKDLLKNISLERKIENPQIKRTCEQTILGNDWFILREKSIVLQPHAPANIPYRQWEKYNCDIKIDMITKDEIKLTIIPNMIPVLGDDTLPDATWKAVVWLESPREQLIQDISYDIPNEEREKKIEELKLCRRNLEIELRELRQKLTALLEVIPDPV